MGRFELKQEKHPELTAFLQAKTTDRFKELYPALKEYYDGVFTNRVEVKEYSSDASYYGKKNYREMILVLLSCPGVLAKFANNVTKDIRAENDSSLIKYIDWYIDEQLLEIADQYRKLTTSTPNAVLDLNEEAALQYYHILIYCIRSVSPSLSSILPFIMAIPSLQNLLIDKKDELLETIKQSDNLAALKILITMPAIRSFIEQDDQYCSGAWLSSSLAELFFDITILPEGYAERQAAAYDGFSKHATSIKAKLHELILEETYAENPLMYDKKIAECTKAIQIGDLPRVQELLKDNVVSNAIDNSIFEEGSSVLDYAIAGRNVEIVQLVLKLEKISTTVAVWNNANLKDVVREGCQEIAEILLNFPQVFALAEKEQDELENYVPCFIAKKLDELKKSKGAELSPRENRLCFYIARHLIRQNKMNEELVFLLQLPGVRALAHTSVSFDKPNELLQVAIDHDNNFAKEQLLQISAVKKLAEKTENSEEEVLTPKAALLSDLRDYCIQQEKKIKGIMRDSFFNDENIYLKAAKHLMKILDGRKNTYKKELLTPLFEEPNMVDLLVKWQIKYDLCHDAILCEKIPPEAREDAELSDYNSLNNNCSDYSFSDGDSSEYDSSEDEKEISIPDEYCSNP